MTLNCVNDGAAAWRRLMVCLSLIDWLEWSFWRKKVSRIRIKVKWNKVIFFEKEFEKCIMQNRKEHLLSFDLTRFDNVWRMSHLAAPALHVSTFWVAKKWNPSLVTPCHKKELWRITRPKVVEKRPCKGKMMLDENESTDSCHDYYTIHEGKKKTYFGE